MGDRNDSKRQKNEIPVANFCKRRAMGSKIRKFRPVWGTRSSMLDWALVDGLSCTKGVWYIYDWDTG